MKKNVLFVLLFAVAALAVSGCQQPAKRSSAGSLAGGIGGGEEFVNVYYLAGRLGMSVSLMTDRKVVFTGGGSTVAIYPKDDYIYFNEKYFGTLGRTKKVDGMLHVRSSLQTQIKSEIEKNTVVEIKPQIIPTPKPAEKPWAGGAGKIIVIDAGHGGKDPGATSPYGFYEKTVNLDVAAQIAGLLREKGFNVIMTRSNDTFVELEERADIGNRNNAVMFVSIHADSCATSTTNGFTIYVARQADWRSKKLAGLIDSQMTQTGIKSRGTSKADYRVLKYSRCPAVLIELGYLSNYWEAQQLKDKDMQKKLALAITSGIINYASGR